MCDDTTAPTGGLSDSPVNEKFKKKTAGPMSERHETEIDHKDNDFYQTGTALIPV